ncbi:MAG: redoxin family protein [Pirellulaceae bacterium]
MFRYSATYAGLLMLVAGCHAERPPSAPVVQVRQASWSETEQLIARHKGKVVIVDVWSTWCAPCVKEFPGLVALQRQYGDQVACISLNCNYTGASGEDPGSARAQIEEFLVKQGATFDNVICTDSDEQLFQTLETAAVPVVRVYDRQGQLRKQFDNDENEYGEQGFSYEQQIAPLVATLVQE